MMARSQTGSGRRAGVKVSRRAVIALPVFAVIASAARRAASQTVAGGDSLPRLSYSGIELAPVIVDRAFVNVSVTIDLAGDRPMASYMAARPRGKQALQRTPGGGWVAWDQRTESLIDNRFASSAGHLFFVVTGANFRAESFPIALEVAYRMPAGVKFGVLTMMAQK
jgi:hypothetical protein